MKNIKKALLSPRGALFFTFIIFNIILAQFHEPWRDEAQVWLLARDMAFYELPGQMHYEGHPCLWHLIMNVLVSLGLPYFIQRVAAFVITSAAVLLVIYAAPFPLWFAGVITFSPVFTYYYPVIARNYCLIPLFVMGLACCFGRRHEKPWLYCALMALLVQTHSVMIVTAFAMGLCFLAENIIAACKNAGKGGRYEGSLSLIKSSAPLLLPFLSAVFWLWQMLNNAKDSALLNVKSEGMPEALEKMAKKALEAVGYATGLGKISLGGSDFGKYASALILLIFAIAYLAVLYVGIRKKNVIYLNIAFVIGFTVIFQFWFYAMVYDYAMQRLLSIPTLIIWGFFISAPEGTDPGDRPLRGQTLVGTDPGAPEGTDPGDRPRGTGGERARFAPTKPVTTMRAAFSLFCIICLFAALLGDIKDNIKRPYSNAEPAAEFIKNNIPDYEEAVFITDNEAEITAIFPYISRIKTLYAPNGMEFTYVTWDKHWNERSGYEQLEALIEKQRSVMGEKGEGGLYIISCPDRSYVEENYRMSDDFELIYKSPSPSIKGEDYEIYRIH